MANFVICFLKVGIDFVDHDLSIVTAFCDREMTGTKTVFMDK